MSERFSPAWNHRHSAAICDFYLWSLNCESKLSISRQHWEFFNENIRWTRLSSPSKVPRIESAKKHHETECSYPTTIRWRYARQSSEFPKQIRSVWSFRHWRWVILIEYLVVDASQIDHACYASNRVRRLALKRQIEWNNAIVGMLSLYVPNRHVLVDLFMPVS